MRRLTFEVTRGALDTRAFVFEQARVAFGRREDCDLRFPASEGQVSNLHAEVVQVGAKVLIRDLKSTNGTFVNDVVVRGDFPLRSGDRLKLGRDGPTMLVAWPVEEAPATQAVDLRGVAIPGLEAPPPEGRTAMFKAMVDQSVQTNSLRLRRTIIALGAVFVVALGGLVFVMTQQRGETEAAKAAADAALGAQGAGPRIARDNERSIFMLIAAKGGELEGFCTAFAVRPDGVLATNAHCVRSIESYVAEGRTILARMNRAPELTWPVIDSKVHPKYSGQPSSPDVALVRLDLGAPGRSGSVLPKVLPVVVTLADDGRLRELAAGQPVFTLGFPGQVMNEAEPAADLRAAELSRVTDFDNAPGTPGTSHLVWHTALTSKGTSGSPLFDADGRVIAVNNGGLSAKTVTVTDPATGKTRTETTYEATGLNFGVRADLLRELLPQP